MTFQQSLNLTDTPRKEYNGWSDWTTWNCALWIGGDEDYNVARRCEDWFDFIVEMQTSAWIRHLMVQNGLKQTMMK